MPTLKRKPTAKTTSISKGYRSGLEEKVAQDLIEAGVDFSFERLVIRYLKPSKESRYTPDFVLHHNSIIIETKGRFLTADRQKHLLVKAQHPQHDIRFVFSRSMERISKKSTTTYADWCRKHGFLFADKSIPLEWLKET